MAGSGEVLNFYFMLNGILSRGEGAIIIPACIINVFRISTFYYKEPLISNSNKEMEVPQSR